MCFDYKERQLQDDLNSVFIRRTPHILFKETGKMLRVPESRSVSYLR